jgi:hypothetical protein
LNIFRTIWTVDGSDFIEDVPVHRFAFKEISAFVSAKTNLSAESFAALLPGID